MDDRQREELIDASLQQMECLDARLPVLLARARVALKATAVGSRLEWRLEAVTPEVDRITEIASTIGDLGRATRALAAEDPEAEGLVMDLFRKVRRKGWQTSRVNGFMVGG